MARGGGLAAKMAGRVTVVIAVWDEYVPFLSEAIESVRAESAHVPIVVVDNASATEVPSIQGTAVVRSPKRLTVGGARNLGIKQVRTEYVIVLDADDKLLPGALDFLTRRIDSDPTLSVSAASILDADTGKRHRTPRPFAARLARWPRTFAVVDCVWSLLPIQGCAIMRTEQVRDSGGYPDANWGDDWVLAVSLAFRGRVEVNERLVRFYRATPESLWRTRRPARELLGSAHLVRERLRRDPAVPAWVRDTVVAIAALQLVAVYVARPLYLAVRRTVNGRDGRWTVPTRSHRPDSRA